MKQIFFTIIIAMAIADYSYSQVTQEWVQRHRGYEASSVSANGDIYVAGINSDSLITIKYSSSGAQQWAQSYSPVFTGHDSPVLKTDSGNNVYVIGNYQGGSVLIKYNSNGVQQWVINFTWTIMRDIEVDNSNNVYITGSASDSVIEEQFVTIKFNSSGIQQWLSNYSDSTSQLDGAKAIAVDDPGNVYVTGYSFVNGSLSYITTVKYNSTGNEQWVQRYGSANIPSSPKALAVDNSQNVYVSGYSSDSGAIIKYNSSGVEQWVVNDWHASSLLVDNSENVYVSGSGADSTGNSSIHLRKYNSSGARQWVSNFSGSESGDDSRIPMILDNSGNVYLSYMNIDTNNFTTNIASAKCNGSGVMQWIQYFNGAGNSDDYSYDIALDNSDNIYVVGRSGDSIANNQFITIKYSLITNVNTAQQINAENFRLEQNYPNPFNPNTLIRYSLIENRFASLKVYDIQGKVVAVLVNTKQNAGSYELIFDGSNLSSGIYFYKLVTAGFTDTKRMILLK